MPSIKGAVPVYQLPEWGSISTLFIESLQNCRVPEFGRPRTERSYCLPIHKGLCSVLLWSFSTSRNSWPLASEYCRDAR